MCWIASDGRSPPWMVMLHLLPIWICILLDSTVFVLIYRTMKRLEQNISKSVTSTTTNTSTLSPTSEEQEEEECHEAGDHISSDGSSDLENGATALPDLSVSMNRRSRVAAVQGMWYIGGFLLTFGPQTLNVFIFFVTGKFIAPVYRMSYFFFALQGVWNFLIFSRGKREMKTWVGKRAKGLVWGGLCCHFYQRARKAMSREPAGDANFSCPSSNTVTRPRSSISQIKKSERIWSWFAKSNDPTEVHDNRKGTSVVSNASTVVCTNGTAFCKEAPRTTLLNAVFMNSRAGRTSVETGDRWNPRGSGTSAKSPSKQKLCPTLPERNPSIAEESSSSVGGIDFGANNGAVNNINNAPTRPQRVPSNSDLSVGSAISNSSDESDSENDTVCTEVAKQSPSERMAMTAQLFPQWLPSLSQDESPGNCIPRCPERTASLEGSVTSSIDARKVWFESKGTREPPRPHSRSLVGTPENPSSRIPIALPTESHTAPQQPMRIPSASDLSACSFSSNTDDTETDLRISL